MGPLSAPWTLLSGITHPVPNDEPLTNHYLMTHPTDVLCSTGLQWVNSFSPVQNGRHFADDIFRCIFVNETFCILIKISLKFVPKGPIGNGLALVWIMAWRRIGVKPLSEPMLYRFTEANLRHWGEMSKLQPLNNNWLWHGCSEEHSCLKEQETLKYSFVLKQITTASLLLMISRSLELDLMRQITVKSNQ